MPDDSNTGNANTNVTPANDPAKTLADQFSAQLVALETKIRAEFETAIDDLAQKFLGALSNTQPQELQWLSSIGRALYYKFVNDQQVNHVGDPPLTDADKAAILAHQQGTK